MEMKSFFMIILLNSPLFCRSKVVKKDNGLTYITGRGCGTLTPIKHFTSMPKDISDLTCAIIKPDKISKSDGKIFGTEHCKFVNKEIGGESYEKIMVSVETRNTFLNLVKLLIQILFCFLLPFFSRTLNCCKRPEFCLFVLPL